MNVLVNTTAIAHRFQTFALDMTNKTASFVTSTLNSGSDRIRATLNVFANTTARVHQLQQFASDMTNKTTSFVTSTVSGGSDWIKVTSQSVLGYAQEVCWWIRLGFAVGAFTVILFGAIYFYCYIRRVCFLIRRRHR